ncbi:hypothetical protein [Nitrospirillum sp. BR 11828]|nr:hypothetical protein [Nitrospirillum sp. BR 11828]MDZ5647435.1 hypothetical protein [Nitrospirillum sp. BR 11828]
MTTITTSHTASRTATPSLMSRLTGLVEVAGMLGVAAIIALCINAML